MKHTDTNESIAKLESLIKKERLYVGRCGGIIADLSGYFDYLPQIAQLDFSTNDRTKQLLARLQLKREHSDYKREGKFPQFVFFESTKASEIDKNTGVISFVDEQDPYTIDSWEIGAGNYVLRLSLLHHIGEKLHVFSTPIRFNSSELKDKAYLTFYYSYIKSNENKIDKNWLTNLIDATKQYLELVYSADFIRLERRLITSQNALAKALTNSTAKEVENLLNLGKILQQPL